MFKYFLDCGSNMGQGYESIKKIYNIENYEIFMFEPNKICFEYLNKTYKKNKIFNKAVWNKDEFRNLNIEYCPTEQKYCGGATNILQENFIKPSYILDEYIINYNNSELVECICFSNFLKNNFNPIDTIILKLDIEGAEIEVLDKLIEDDTLMYVNTIIVEWHFHMRKSNHSTKEYYINLFNKYNINYLEWH